MSKIKIFNKDRFSTPMQEIVAILAIYFFFSVLYYFVLVYNEGGFTDSSLSEILSFKSYWYGSGMQYLFFFISSLFIGVVAIYLLRNQSTMLQMIMVFLLIPVTIYYVRTGRYALLDYLGKGRLTGTGTVWDLYIPYLFFLTQFSFYFTYKYFKEYQNKIKTEAALRQANLKSELSAIKSQLNPHFLYNVFNTISASLPPENEKTRQMIAQLSDMFRYQLKASSQETVSLKEELDFVSKYLDLEKERFEHRLRIKIEVDESLYNSRIPPMILQPLIENSIKHGLSPLINGGEILLKISKQKDKIFFELADTGVGVTDKIAILEKGIGLKNTKLRLYKMYGAELKMMDNEPGGLKIQFAI